MRSTLLMTRLLQAVRSTFGLIAATMTAGFTMIGLTSHGGVTMLVVGGLFQQAYRDRGLAPQNLSRSLEDSVTITEALMPWTVSAVFMADDAGRVHGGIRAVGGVLLAGAALLADDRRAVGAWRVRDPAAGVGAAGPRRPAAGGRMRGRGCRAACRLIS